MLEIAEQEGVRRPTDPPVSAREQRLRSKMTKDLDAARPRTCIRARTGAVAILDMKEHSG